MSVVDRVRRLFAVLRELARRYQADPLAFFRPNRAQREFLGMERLRCLFRGPNQGVGKTTAMAVDVLERMLGRPKWVPARFCRRRRIVAWVLCHSWAQSLEVQQKVWELLPPAELHADSKYSAKNGFSGARFQTKNGSLCRFITANQGTLAVASGTVHVVLCDEPFDESLYGELSARVMQRKGQLKITMTPVGLPVKWLQERVEKGQIAEVHAELTLEECWAIGASQPYVTQEQIDQFILDVPEFERPQRIKGSWEGVTAGRWVASFDPNQHVRTASPEPGWRLAVGFDYGLQPGKMAAALIAVRGGFSTRPEVCFWDEVAAGDDDTWGLEDLALFTQDMLERNGLGYEDIDEWTGDRPAQGRSGKVNNRDMRAHLSVVFERLPSAVRIPKVPRKGAGSVAYGCGLINSVFARNMGWVHPRCARLREFFAHFNGDDRMSAKDAGDAHRYAFLSLVNPAAWYRKSLGTAS